MSNISAHKKSQRPERKIEIKPIESIQVEKNEQGHYITTEDETMLMEHKLQKAKEELQSIKEQKESMLLETIADINEEKQNWEQEKQTLIEQAKHSGYESGFALGKQESKEKYKQLLDEANEIVRTATKDYHATIDQSDGTIVKLATYTAEKIIKQTLVEQPDVFLNIVVNAIKEIKDQSIISIYLHPSNYQYVLQQKDELLAGLDGDVNVSIYIDRKITENSCHIEHPLGKVDASVDTQLEQIRTTLIDVIKENKQ